MHVAPMQNPPAAFFGGTNIYPIADGWVYEVWFLGRVVVIGCCATLEAAMRAATNV
jgi:hypothetical protein